MSNDTVPIDEKIIVQSRIISLNSKYATDKINGSKLSNVSFDFNSIASKNRETLYHTVAIQSAEITASYYNVNSSNNVINITQAGIAAQAIAIPEGNYDAETFATAFNAGVGATNPVTLAFNSTTGKFSLVSATLAITLNVAATTAQSIIGIDPASTTDLVFPTGGAVATAFPRLANFLGITKIKLGSNALAGDNYDSYALSTTTLVDTISATAVPFGITIFNSLGRESYIKAKRIDELDFQLLDQNNEFIDFNNVDWTLTLILNTHRRQTFSNDSGVIINDKVVASEKAKEPVDTIKEELEDVTFDLI
jgi:hypothetical protein